MDPVPQTCAILALRKELITVRSRHNPRRDKCDSGMVEKRQGKIKHGNKTNEGEKKKKKQECGETERDTVRSVEALVARLPRMLSDSGRLMTGIRLHSESERAGATLHTGAPLSLGQSKQAAQPAPPAATGCCLSSNPTIHLSIYPIQCLIRLINRQLRESSVCVRVCVCGVAQ